MASLGSALLRLLQAPQLVRELGDHQHGTPAQSFLGTHHVPVDVVPDVQNLVAAAHAEHRVQVPVRAALVRARFCGFFLLFFSEANPAKGASSASDAPI